jgi:hypothetical protein
MKTHITGMKLFISSILIMTSIGVFGQSFTISPEQTTSESSSGDNIILKSGGEYIGLQSLRYKGTATAKTTVLNNDYLLRIGAGGFYNSSSNFYDKSAIFFRATENWAFNKSGTKISFFTTKNGTTSSLERMTIGNDGKIGIGIVVPLSNLHLHEPTTASSVNFQLTNADAGATANDGFQINLNPSLGLFDFAVNINNKENAPLLFGTNNTPRLVIDETGKVGIGTLTPAKALHVFTGLSGVTPNASSTAFIESNTHNYLNLATTNTAEQGILFGKPTTGAESGGIIYTSTNKMEMRTGGNFTRMIIDNTGNVGIGTSTPDNKLDVLGIIRANELILETGWADYVFEESYKLRSIDELDTFIKANKHLPNIPKASEIETEGLKVASTNKAMMEKIEELALYIIQLKKEIDVLKSKVK